VRPARDHARLPNLIQMRSILCRGVSITTFWDAADCLTVRRSVMTEPGFPPPPAPGALGEPYLSSRPA